VGQISSNERLIEEILAKDQIRGALLRYTRGVDRLDVALIDSSFHPDAIIEHGGMVFDGKGWGAAIVETMAKVAKNTRHMIANQSIEIDGGAAYSETYCYAHILEDAPDDSGEQLLNRAVRYVDQFELRDGEWRVIFRKTVLDWDRIEPIVARPPLLAYVQASRSTDDVSYLRPLKPDHYDTPISNGEWVLR
jgi:hypothetical protein